MNALQKLERLFTEFPGIGPRQAKRFVYFLLSKNAIYTNEITSLIRNLGKEINLCAKCFRFFSKDESGAKLCRVCSDPLRETSQILIVATDIDLENIEKSGVFKGLYFVLGGTVPILEKEPEKKVRINDLKKRLEKEIGSKQLKEVVLAFNANPEGENTDEFVRRHISSICETGGVKISTLGKGLSTGLELEYSDEETLKNALNNRQ